jgi:hypothetical protein
MSRRGEPEDPLAVINAGLREQDADEDPDSPWLPLESNPVRVLLEGNECYQLLPAAFTYLTHTVRFVPSGGVYRFRTQVGRPA